MGFDLIGENRYFCWNSSAWPDVLDIATRHGWRPMGTGAPEEWSERDWIGGYGSNDGQLVDAGDALRPAEALEKFLSKHQNIPNNEARFCSAGGKEYLREFIRFCRRGSFRLY